MTKEPVAIKAESSKETHHQLRNEAEILDYLQGGDGIPHCYYYSSQNGCESNLLVLDLLGSSLEWIKETCMHTFTLQAVLLLADQMVSISLYYYCK